MGSPARDLKGSYMAKGKSESPFPPAPTKELQRQVNKNPLLVAQLISPEDKEARAEEILASFVYSKTVKRYPPKEKVRLCEILHEKLDYPLEDLYRYLEADGRGDGTEEAESFPGYELPEGYSVQEGAIYKTGETPILVTTTPIFLKKQIHDVDNDVDLIEVELFTPYGQRTRIVEAPDLFDARRIIKLSAYALDVSTRTASQVTGFVQAYNRHKPLPLVYRTAKLGFRPVGPDKVYLLDRTYPERSDLIFDTQSELEQRRQAAMQPTGSLQEWGKALEKILPYPRVVVGLLAALVPPVRELLDLDAHSFPLHYYAQSTTGKTVSQKISLSAWANPESSEWLHHGEATFAGMEALCLSTFGLPVFVEDVHRMRPEDISRLIYAVANEQWKARGGRQTRTQWPWHGGLITSGELPLIDPGSYRGEAARTIQLSGSPFGEHSEEKRNLIEKEILPVIRQNHGLLGPAVLQLLLGLGKEKPNDLRALYQQAKAMWAEQAEDRPLLARQAPQWAAMEIAGAILGHIFAQQVARRAIEALRVCFEQCLSEPTPSPVKQAHTVLVGMIQSNQANCRLWEGEKYNEQKRPGELIGVINEEEGFVACWPHIARRLLRQEGHTNPTQILQAMRDEGLLKPDGRHLEGRVRFGGKQNRMYIFNLHADEQDSE